MPGVDVFGPGSCVVTNPGVGGSGIECFVSGVDRGLKQRAWTPAPLTPHPWNDQFSGVAIEDDVSCVAFPPDQIHCFAVGYGSAMPYTAEFWHKWWDGEAWRRWESLGRPAVVSSTSEITPLYDAGVECLATGERTLSCIVSHRNGIWHRSWDGWSWGAWELLWHRILGAPACVSRAQGLIDCFARSNLYTILQFSFDGARWTFNHLAAPGPMMSNLSCVSWDADRLDCFVVSNSELYQSFWSSSRGWGRWANRGGTGLLGADCASAAPGRIACAAVASRPGSSGSTMVLSVRDWYTNTQSTWTDLSLTVAAAHPDYRPECVVMVANRVDCFVAGGRTFTNLHHFGWTP